MKKPSPQIDIFGHVPRPRTRAAAKRPPHTEAQFAGLMEDLREAFAEREKYRTQELYWAGLDRERERTETALSRAMGLVLTYAESYLKALPNYRPLGPPNGCPDGVCLLVTAGGGPWSGNRIPVPELVIEARFEFHGRKSAIKAGIAGWNRRPFELPIQVLVDIDTAVEAFERIKASVLRLVADTTAAIEGWRLNLESRHVITIPSPFKKSEFHRPHDDY